MNKHPDHEVLSELMVRRLSGFILGVGIDEVKARQIIVRAIADDPLAAPADIEAKARAWMLIALA